MQNKAQQRVLLRILGGRYLRLIKRLGEENKLQVAGGLVVLVWLVYKMMPFHELQEGEFIYPSWGLVRASQIREGDQRKVE